MTADIDPSLLTIIITFAVSAGIVVISAYFFFRKKTKVDQLDAQHLDDTTQAKQLCPSFKQEEKRQKKEKWRPEKVLKIIFTLKFTKKSFWVKDAQYDHPWFVTTFKGNVGRVMDMDFSSNGKYLVSVADDRALIYWNIKDFGDTCLKAHRGTIDFDHARFVRFGPDSKSIIVALAMANKIGVYKLKKKEDNSHTFKFMQVNNAQFSNIHEKNIVSIGIACTGQFLMSASSDNKLVIYDLKGQLLKVIESKQNGLHKAIVSHCGRFVASSGFTPDVLVWEGHSSGVYSFDFNQDSSRALTASKDGTWKLYDIDIRYKDGQEPRQVGSGSWDALRTFHSESVFAVLTPSGDSFVIGVGRNIRMYSSDGTPTDGQHRFRELLDVHSEALTALRFSVCGRYLASCGDRYIRVFHNIPEYESSIDRLKMAIGKVTGEAHKRRLTDQLKKSEQHLQQLLNEE